MRQSRDGEPARFERLQNTAKLSFHLLGAGTPVCQTELKGQLELLAPFVLSSQA